MSGFKVARTEKVLKELGAPNTMKKTSFFSIFYSSSKIRKRLIAQIGQVVFHANSINEKSTFLKYLFIFSLANKESSKSTFVELSESTITLVTSKSLI